VSIAAVALAHGLNANMLRKWVIDAERGQASRDAPGGGAVVPSPAQSAMQTPSPSPMFVPLTLPTPAAADGEIRIELQRGGSTVKIAWPASAARDCAAWLSDWLR
jgi:hypothetical protein